MKALKHSIKSLEIKTALVLRVSTHWKNILSIGCIKALPVWTILMSVSLFSAASCVGTEEQRVQRQAYDVAPLPQPSTTERAAHAAECHLPRILSSGQHNAPQFPPFAGKQLPKLPWKRQQRHLPSFTIQLRTRQSIPDARWVQTVNNLGLFLPLPPTTTHLSALCSAPFLMQRLPLLPTCPQRSRWLRIALSQWTPTSWLHPCL